MEWLFTFLGTFMTILYPITLILFIFGVPLSIAAIVRLVLHFKKYDKKKANRIFWVIVGLLLILWVIILFTFFVRVM